MRQGLKKTGSVLLLAFVTMAIPFLMVYTPLAFNELYEVNCGRWFCFTMAFVFTVLVIAIEIVLAAALWMVWDSHT